MIRPWVRLPATPPFFPAPWPFSVVFRCNVSGIRYQVSGRGGRVKSRFAKNKTTTIVKTSFKAFSFSIGTAGPHNIAIVNGWNNIRLEVEQKKGFRKKP